MKRPHKLRRLLMTAGLALVLLPLVALGGWVTGGALATQSGDMVTAAELEAVRSLAADYAASLWDLLPENREPFAQGLTRLAPDQTYFVEVRSLDDQVLFSNRGETAGPGVAQGVALVRKDGKTLGIVQVWMPPRPQPESSFRRTLSAGVRAGSLTLALLLLCVVWYSVHVILRPLRALEKATAALAAGSFDFVVPESQVQELTTLSLGFVTMRDRLQAALDRQQALERKQS